MTKWEYCHVFASATSREGDIQEADVSFSEGATLTYKGDQAKFSQLSKMLGDQGWELVSYQVAPLIVGSGTAHLSFFVFKRPGKS